jgi:hypothetical protein
MPTKREQIIFEALDIITSKPLGIRYSELCQNINQKLADIKLNYIKSIIVNLDKTNHD